MTTKNSPIARLRAQAQKMAKTLKDAERGKSGISDPGGKLAADGTQWCVLLGGSLADGVAGFGDTPDLAMIDFDKNFYNARTPRASYLAEK